MALSKDARALKRLENMQKKTEQKLKWLRGAWVSAIDRNFVSRHIDETLKELAVLKSEINHLKNLSVR